MNRIFVIGNGESRKSFDLTKLKNHGKIFGCNGFYRDFVTDGLVSVDPGIMHEIYNNGYAKNNVCYFRGWTPVPEAMYDDILKASKSNMYDMFGEEPKVIESEKPNNSKEFVIHSASASWQGRLIKEKRDYKGIGSNLIFLTWLTNDKVKEINEHMIIDNKKEDYGWCAGSTIMNIACNQEQPDEVYIIGCDLYSNTGKVNNMYKDTLHYESGDINAVIPTNWIEQFKVNFFEFPNTDFYKVNQNSLDTNKVNSKIDSWEECINIKYITQAQMLDNMSKW
tara:strand:- start:828 stop:1667 length:840 start_codon:yes stop_codon:yes gene_type:complete